MSSFRPTRFVFALCFVAFSAASSQAAVVTVDCSKKSAKSINATLATLDKSATNTVKLVGACKELVVIERFRDLTLVGSAGASISDPTPSDPTPSAPDDEIDTVLYIGPQSNVTLRSLTITGGASGISCVQISICTLEDVIVEDVKGAGVSFGRSSGTLLGNTIIRGNLGGGLALGASIVGGGQLVDGGPSPQIIDNLGGHGVRMTDNSTFRGGPYTIAGNFGDGVNAFASAVSLGGSPDLRTAVTGNGGRGIFLQSSTLRGGYLSVTGNTKNGVVVSQLSFFRSGLDAISGNGEQPDVHCASVTAATSGTGGSLAPTLGGGTTDCTEPAP